MEIHPTFFLIKNQKIKTILLRGRCIGELYPLAILTIKKVCSAMRSVINI